MRSLRIFLRLPLSVTPIRILSVNKMLGNLGRIQFIAKSSLQLSLRTNIAKIEDKKLLRKISFKNITAGVLFCFMFWSHELM